MPVAHAEHLLLLGHRGARARKEIPENTIASFDQALVDGCDGFEFDVRRTADGVAVVCHDPEFEGVEISRATALRLSQLPRLEQVLLRYRASAFLDIELKVPGVERTIVELLRKHPPARGFVVSSFLPKVLSAIRAADAAIPLGLICETKAELQERTRLRVQYVIPHRALATAALIRELRAARKRIFVWTVNDEDDMRRFRDMGVDGIISDDTVLLRRTMDPRK